MTKILTPRTKAEINEVLAHFGAAHVKVSEKDGVVLLTHKLPRKKGVTVEIDNMDLDFFLRAHHMNHARIKALRRLIGKTLNNLMAQGVDFKAINRAA